MPSLGISIIIYLLVTVGAMYAVHGLIIDSLKRTFLGPLRWHAGWGFAKGMSRRVFGYVVLPLVLVYFGTGVRLFPDPQFQSALAKPSVVKIQPDPYSAETIERLDTRDLQRDITAAIIGTIIMVCAMRIVVLFHNPKLLWTIIYLAMTLFGFALFTFFTVGSFFQLFFDSVLRYKSPNSVWLVALAGAATGVVLEGLLDQFPYCAPREVHDFSS